MRAWLLSTILALGPAPGPSRVEIDVDGLELHMSRESLHRFHGELLMRLVEAGHGIGADGDVVLSLTSAGETIVVECRGEGVREQIEVDDADAAVLGLELVHRAVDLVERCTAGADPIGDGMVLDSDGSIEVSELVVELAEAPITLVADPQHASTRMCVREGGVWVVEIDDSCDAGSAVAELEPHAAIERWQASTSVEPSTTEPPPPEPSEAQPSVAPPSEPVRVRAWGLSVGAAGGIALRFPGIGASVHADAGALHRSGVFVGGHGSIAPSGAEQLKVIDGLGLAAFGWRGQISDRVVLRPSLGVGVAVHRYTYADEPVGHRFDLALRVPLELDLRLSKRLYASFAIAGTVGTRRIEHLLGDRELWTRGVFRLDALIGLRFDCAQRCRM